MEETPAAILKHHHTQDQNTTLVDDNILQTAQDIAGDKYQFWYFEFCYFKQIPRLQGRSSITKKRNM